MTVEPLARNTPVSTPKSTAKPSRTHRTLRRGSATGARLVGAEDPPGPHGPGRCRGRLRRGRPPRLASRAELLLVGDGGSDRFVVEVVALGNLSRGVTTTLSILERPVYGVSEAAGLLDLRADRTRAWLEQRSRSDHHTRS